MCFLYLELEISGKCDGTYDSATSSYITSPNYPRHYGRKVLCTWTIRAPKNRAIGLNFTEFFTEDGKDELSIYNRSSEGMWSLETARHTVQVLSGKNYSGMILFTTHIGHLKFTSSRYTPLNTGDNRFKILLNTYGKQTHQNYVLRNVQFMKKSSKSLFAILKLNFIIQDLVIVKTNKVYQTGMGSCAPRVRNLNYLIFAMKMNRASVQKPQRRHNCFRRRVFA